MKNSEQQSQQEKEKEIVLLQQQVRNDTHSVQHAITNQYLLQNMTTDLGNAYNRMHGRSDMGREGQALKMQKQDDIRNQIQHDNNLILFCGLGLIVVFITILLLYL